MGGYVFVEARCRLLSERAGSHQQKQRTHDLAEPDAIADQRPSGLFAGGSQQYGSGQPADVRTLDGGDRHS